MTNILDQSQITEEQGAAGVFPIAVEDPDNAGEPLGLMSAHAEYIAIVVAGLEALSGDNRLNHATLRNNPIINYHEWTPTITNLKSGETVDMITGNAFEIGGGVQFTAQFRAQNTGIWTIMKPRLSLPVAAASPSRVVGGGQGYGGSENKFITQLFADDPVSEGDISGATNIRSATVHDGTIYIGRTSGRINTLNLSTRVATLYGDFGGQFWEAMKSHDGNLYTYDTTQNQRMLHRIESASTATPIGNDTGIVIVGMASLDGTLWGWSATDRLYSINTTTGALTQVGSTAPSATNIQSLVRIDNKLYGSNNASPYELYEINTATAALTEVERFTIGIGSMFVVDGVLYGIEANGVALYSFNLNIPPILSVDFEGDDYTSAIAQCEEQSNLIQVNVEKLQRNDSDAFISISGSYKK